MIVNAFINRSNSRNYSDYREKIRFYDLGVKKHSGRAGSGTVNGNKTNKEKAHDTGIKCS